MEGYDLRTIDGDKVGRVVDTDGDYLIVEHGLLKTKHALPKQYAEVHAEKDVVQTNLTKELIYESPKIDGEVDAAAVDKYYDDCAGLSDAPTRASVADLEHEHTFHPNLNDAFLVQDRSKR